MSIWTRISDFVFDTATTALSGVIEQVRTMLEGDPETRAKVAFSIAMIALSAKMAKADGIVTEAEVDAFREIFDIPDAEAGRVARLYNLAKQDTAGFETYARQLAGICGSTDGDCPVLTDILDGLFHIAKADGVVHEKELAFLRTIAGIFAISDPSFDSIVARHVDGGADDPWRILGLARDADFETARARYRQLARENHPDAIASRALPDEFINITRDRIAAINGAWEVIEKSYRREKA